MRPGTSGSHPAAQRSEGAQWACIHSPQWGGLGVRAAGACYLETLELLPPKVTGRDEDDLLQAPGREGDGADL